MDSSIAQNLVHTCRVLADTCKHLAELVSKQEQELAVLKAAGEQQQEQELAVLKAAGEQQQEQELAHPNSLEHFLADASICSFGPDLRMPREDFVRRYREYCMVKGMRPRPWNGDNHLFQRYGIQVTGKASHTYSGQKINTVWLQGVDVLDGDQDDAY
jgi:hypothetical protein